MVYARQGDLKFTKAELPKNYKVKKDRVVARGEHTNHSHRFETAGVKLLEWNDELYVQADETVELLHEEHKPLILEKGVYKVGYEREYDYFLEEVRRVVD